jgi:hypothetical protein
VSESADEPCSFDPPPFSLRTHPQRPGELAELIEVSVDAAEASRVRMAAAAVGVPVELAVYISVEAGRALEEAIEIFGLGEADAVAFLDAAAAETHQRGPRHLLVRRLEEYASALVRGLPTIHIDAGRLRAHVPHRVAAAWGHAAAAAGVPFDCWLADAVRRANLDRAPWEAAAARTGRSLAEWVLLQAARCARSRSTSPQTTACD